MSPLLLKKSVKNNKAEHYESPAEPEQDADFSLQLWGLSPIKEKKLIDLSLEPKQLMDQ